MCQKISHNFSKETKILVNVTDRYYKAFIASLLHITSIYVGFAQKLGEKRPYYPLKKKMRKNSTEDSQR